MNSIAEIIKPIANSQLDNTNKTNSQLVDHLLGKHSELIDPSYKKWFAGRFYRLGESLVERCASEAKADGSDPKRLFAFLINKNS